MRVSVIFSTYNSPQWLEKVLWGYEFQSHSDFEIIVADDGSDDRTRALLSRIQSESDLQITHVWQEDQGFRKCRILNKAIVAARNDYIVFSDGDCIPRSDFLAEHIKSAEQGYYLSGSYFKLPISTSELISQQDVATGQCFDLNWLKANGLNPGRKHRKLAVSATQAKWLNRLTPTRCNLKGSNASAWRKDLLRINGYDERMGWGGQDRELGVRLKNAGIKPRHVRYNAICVHLDHSRGYIEPDVIAANKAIRVASEQDGTKTTEHGILQLNEKPKSLETTLP